jgi:alpha-glucosidase
MMMVKASRDGILKAHPDKRPFVLSRSNYLGGQRFAATWTGDNMSTWEHFKMSTPMVLNMGLSGQPFCGPDLGGYKGTPDAELFANWISIGAFYPFCRDHTELNGGNQEPYAFGKKVEDISRTALDRRYRLLPYLYTLFHEASVTGLPVMRPVFFADVKDTTLRKEQEAFLWGNDLLIIPKWAKKPALPSGIWRTVSITGEDSKNDAYQPDLKLRGGAIVPLTQIIQSTADYKTDSLTLLVCFDKQQNAEGKLYSDAGEGFSYKNGDFELMTFKAKLKGVDQVSLECEHSEGNLKDKNRHYRIGVVSENNIVYSGWEKGSLIEFKLKNR